MPASVPEARRRVRSELAAQGIGPDHPLTDTVLLVVSELVTNAVRHAAEHSPRTRVGIAVGPMELVVTVHDRHPHCPQALAVPHQDGSGGWGLGLVAELAELVGGGMDSDADPDGGGKTMVVRLPFP
ncbi:ATP-binding protein [Kitasatospora paracochleata]|uniref:Anti-sigma regulatory factor (Ser/Thr protein kinase) n=1 Tax=Kitasatospora paracochleata TaxID=58354 RepID=A0ABT1ITN6_9ACTN|nr:ATP-binding protein [Kitasatospora paracochleata]MCP2308324.1 anti-sigma regulatory factor (Ser/Thr protein kinase) [Kitasatospora paracochleata]